MEPNEIDEVGYSIEILCQRRTIVEVTVGRRIREEQYRSVQEFLSLWNFNIRFKFLSPDNKKKLKICYCY